MLDYQIFLGFHLSTSYQECLRETPLPVRSLFIQDNGEYLAQINYEDSSYLGKSLGPLVELQNLELLEANVYSLLRRLVPDYPYERHPLILLPISINRDATTG
jgi:hypothetical protein